MNLVALLSQVDAGQSAVLPPILAPGAEAVVPSQPLAG